MTDNVNCPWCEYHFIYNCNDNDNVMIMCPNCENEIVDTGIEL